MVTPEPPVNVRLVYADGTQAPAECTYAGLDDDGVHQWEVINHRPETPREMLVEMLPPRTSVAVSLTVARTGPR